jgi:ribose transport system ATP-binding protein
VAGGLRTLRRDPSEPRRRCPAARAKASTMRPFLKMQGVSKTFPGVRALQRIDLAVRQGEVHAIAGENGAGKSTLMKILTGVIEADPGGTILIEDEPVKIRDPMHARALGISIIYQELSMVENLTVAENIFLAREPAGRAGFIDTRRMNREARDVLALLDLDIPPTTPVSRLSSARSRWSRSPRRLRRRPASSSWMSRPRRSAITRP